MNKKIDMNQNKKQTNGWATGLFGGIVSLLIGLKTTLKIFVRKKSTEQYPENRDTLVMFDRFRGQLVMPHDEQGQNRCIACGLCQSACPNDTLVLTISTSTDTDGKRSKKLERYAYDLGACMFCQLCVNACPADAIRFDTSFEHAVYEKDKLIKVLNKQLSL